MKKKLFTTAIVCTLSAACVFGVTACNSGGDDSGSGAPDVGPSVQVDEAGWIAAVGNTLCANNLTYYLCGGDNMYYTVSETGYVCENERYLIAEGVEGQRTFREYYYTLFDYDNSQSYSCANVGNGWNMLNHTLGLTQYDSAIAELAEEYAYSAFTYNGDKYAGTLITGEVELKINSDGYISYFGFGQQDEKYSYTFYNYGKTSYNVPEEAKKVVEDYINSKN